MDKDYKKAVNQVVEDANGDEMRILARLTLTLERLEDLLGEVFEFQN